MARTGRSIEVSNMHDVLCSWIHDTSLLPLPDHRSRRTFTVCSTLSFLPSLLFAGLTAVWFHSDLLLDSLICAELLVGWHQREWGRGSEKGAGAERLPLPLTLYEYAE